MKKTGKVLTFSAAMIASAGLSGCAKTPAELARELYNIVTGNQDDYDPSSNVEEALYAGPDYYDDYDSDDNVIEDIYAGPDFYDDYYEDENEEPTLYAGPDYYEEYYEEEDASSEDTDTP